MFQVGDVVALDYGPGRVEGDLQVVVMTWPGVGSWKTRTLVPTNNLSYCLPVLRNTWELEYWRLVGHCPATESEP